MLCASTTTVHWTVASVTVEVGVAVMVTFKMSAPDGTLLNSVGMTLTKTELQGFAGSPAAPALTRFDDLTTVLLNIAIARGMFAGSVT